MAVNHTLSWFFSGHGTAAQILLESETTDLRHPVRWAGAITRRQEANRLQAWIWYQEKHASHSDVMKQPMGPEGSQNVYRCGGSGSLSLTANEKDKENSCWEEWSTKTNSLPLLRQKSLMLKVTQLNKAPLASHLDNPLTCVSWLLLPRLLLRKLKPILPKPWLHWSLQTSDGWLRSLQIACPLCGLGLLMYSGTHPAWYLVG